MKTYHEFWDNFDVELYRKVVKIKQIKKDLENHLKVFVI